MPVTTPGEVKDQELTGSWFTVELNGMTAGAFTDASGLNFEIEVVTENATLPKGDTRTRKRPGTTKYQDISLKRQLTEDKAFWNWAKSIRDGKMDFRKDGAIVMYDMSGAETGRWTFVNAWPSKWSASDLDVGSDDPMIEEVTLAVEELKREK